MSFRKRFYSLIFIIMILVGCGGRDYAKTVLATSDGGVVTGQDFFDEYNAYSRQEKSEIKTYDDYYKIVRKLALKKIIYAHALAAGLDRKPEVEAKLTEAKKNIGYEIMHKRNVLDKIQVLESDFNKYKKSYSLYQIVRRTDTLDESRIANSRRIMQNLAATIKTLEEFKSNAAKYSEDITAGKGGYMGNIRRGLLEDELDAALSKLSDGEMSAVVETNTGLHLLFVEKINTHEVSDLIHDKSIYDEIYNNKRIALESSWYEKLLKDAKLTVNKNNLKSGTDDNAAVIVYEDKVITKSEIEDTVYNLRLNGSFPEPTQDELNQIVDNMALNLVVNNKAISQELTQTPEFIRRYAQSESAILEAQYIDDNVNAIEPSEEEISRFYLDNVSKLFTFKDENDKTVVQSQLEARDFITDKLKENSRKSQKFALYRAEINSGHFKANEKNINSIMADLEKSK